MNKVYKLTLILGLTMSFLASCNTYYNAAMKDVKENRITSTTVSNLETSKSSKSKHIESYYQLTRVYHYDNNFQNIDKAKEYYLYLIDNYDNPIFESQYKKMKNNLGVGKNTLEVSLKLVNDLIDTRTFNEYIALNTLKGYKEFIEKYPNSNHFYEAQSKAYYIVLSLNTLDSYKNFLLDFPDYRSNDIKDNAYKKAVELNTIEDYKKFLVYFPKFNENSIKDKILEKITSINTMESYNQYLVDFNNYNKLKVYELAFQIAKESNTISCYERYMKLFPNSNYYFEATKGKDFIIFSDFIKSIEKKSLLDQLVQIDDFVYLNASNFYLTKFVDLTLELLPEISTLSEYQKISQQFLNSKFKTVFMNTTVNNYLEISAIKVYEVQKIIDELSELQADDDINVRKEKYTQGIKTINNLLINVTISEEMTEKLKDAKLEMEFFMEYINLVEIAKNVDKYSANTHIINVKKIKTLLKSTKYVNCEKWSDLVKYFNSLEVNIECDKCNGNGKVPATKCYVCKGRGEVRCDNQVTLTRKEGDSWSGYTQNSYQVYCQGGRLQRDNPYYNEICNVCNGSGKKTCEKCNGWGEITECSKCKGEGSIIGKYIDYYGEN
jgi:hypothetical protein